MNPCFGVWYKIGSFEQSSLYLFQQALPYVTLLIMLMFFMYAVIGMQVRWSLYDSAIHNCLLVLACFLVALTSLQ